MEKLRGNYKKVLEEKGYYNLFLAYEDTYRENSEKLHDIIRKVNNKLIVFYNTYLLIRLPSDRFSQNEDKIFSQLAIISNLWFIYELIYSYLGEFIPAKGFTKTVNSSSRNKGDIINGYDKKAALNKAIFKNSLENFSERLSHLISYKSEKQKYTIDAQKNRVGVFISYIEFLVQQNIDVACTQQNQHLEKKIIKLRKIQKNIVPKNKKKCDVTDVQDESIEDFSIETFLSFFYVIRNHYVHNGQTATGEITNKENLKHKLDFLIFLNNELENFVLNLHFTLITKQFNLKES